MKFFTLIFLAVLSSTVNAQSGKIFIKSNTNPTTGNSIQIKWYHKELISDEGVNLYRKEQDGKWEKINKKPFKLSNFLPEEAYQADPELRIFTKLVTESKLSDLPGMVLLNVLLKSFQSNVYANYLGIYYEDKNIEVGKSYQYQARQINYGMEYEIQTSPFIVAGIATELEAPQNVKIKSDTLKAKIYWTEEPTRFYAADVFRATSSAPSVFEKRNSNPIMNSDRPKKDTTNIYHFVDDSLSQNTSYIYKIIGRGMFGEESLPSNTVSVTIKDLIAASSPINVRRKIKNPSVIIMWSNPGDKDIVGFNMYRSTTSNGIYQKINTKLLPLSDSVFTDKLNKTGPYYYHVSSVDASGNEGKSEYIFAEVHDITPPTKPTGLVCKADTGFISLSWNLNLEPDILGYQVFRTSEKNTKDFYVLLNANPTTVNGFIERLPKNARSRFYYKVIAIDSSFNKSVASDVVSAKMPDIFPPAAPHLKSIVPDGDGFKIEWIPNADKDFKQYIIFKADGKKDINFSQLIEINNKATNEYKDVKCSEGTKYYYYMQAADSSGNLSFTSATISGIIPINDIPKELDKKTIKVSYNKNQKKVDIDWKLPKSENVQGTIIYKKLGSEMLMPITNALTITGFSDTNIKKGAKYAYMIKIFMKDGSYFNSSLYNISIE